MDCHFFILHDSAICLVSRVFCLQPQVDIDPGEEDFFGCEALAPCTRRKVESGVKLQQ